MTTQKLGKREQQILDYLKTHPGSSTAEITRGIFPATSRPFRLIKAQMSNSVRNLESKGLIVRATVDYSENTQMSLWRIATEADA